MKTSVILAVSALLAPGLGSVLMTKGENQMNQYHNMNECKNKKKPMYQAAPQPNKCYEMQGNSEASYFQYGNQYQPQMYPQHGCKGEMYRPPKSQCCQKGKYKSYMMYEHNNPRDKKEEEGKKEEEKKKEDEKKKEEKKYGRDEKEEEEKKKEEEQEEKKEGRDDNEEEKKKEEEEKKKDEEDEKKQGRDEKKKGNEKGGD